MASGSDSALSYPYYPMLFLSGISAFRHIPEVHKTMKKPNHAPEPTSTAVTRRAAHVSRQLFRRLT
jgi:hypothetical protein